MSVFKKINPIGIVAGLLIVLGALLPLIEAFNVRFLEYETIRLMDMQPLGYIMIGAGVFILLFAVVRSNILMILGDLVAGALFALVYISLQRAVDQVSASLGAAEYSLKIGFWVLVFGIILAFIGAVVGIIAKKKTV